MINLARMYKLSNTFKQALTRIPKPTNICARREEDRTFKELLSRCWYFLKISQSDLHFRHSEYLQWNRPAHYGVEDGVLLSSRELIVTGAVLELPAAPNQVVVLPSGRAFVVRLHGTVSATFLLLEILVTLLVAL